MSVKEFKINVENCVPHLLSKKIFLSLHSKSLVGFSRGSSRMSSVISRILASIRPLHGCSIVKHSFATAQNSILTKICPIVIILTLITICTSYIEIIHNSNPVRIQALSIYPVEPFKKIIFSYPSKIAKH